MRTVKIQSSTHAQDSTHGDLVGAMMGNCVGGLTAGPFLATSSRASMSIFGDLSLSNPVFVYQLTDVVNVTMQLSNVAVLDNCKSAYINGLIEMFVEASLHMYF